MASSSPAPRRAAPVLAVWLAAALLAGCAASRRAPVVERPGDAVATPAPATPDAAVPAPSPAVTSAEQPAESHEVQKGETLYSIARAHNVKPADLAAWNGLEPNAPLQPGQRLVLKPADARPGTPLSAASGVTVKPLGGEAAKPVEPAKPPAASAPLKNEPKAVKLPYSDKALAQLQAQPPPAAAAPDAKPSEPKAVPVEESLDWGWPADGKAITASLEGSTGVDIPGKAGQPVRAAAAGKVSHAGANLRGYGKLVIIQHNAMYLSVYAHNRTLLVKEGDKVAKGQPIAEMGNSDSDRVKLHFEIRKYGKPVDPLKLLPAR